MAGLLWIIRKEKDVRSLFGKKEIEIIEKQLLGIRLKPSERTRLSRDIRKKFEAIRKLSDFKTEFDLKKGYEVRLKINDALEVILNTKYRNRIKKIFLFGSTAEDRRHFNSDIDIAVLFDDIDLKEATRFRIGVLGNFNDKMDIQVYNTLPDKIKKEIDEKGKILYERKN